MAPVYSDFDLARENGLSASDIDDSGHVTVERPDGPVDYQPSSVDLHLGEELLQMERQKRPIVVDDESTYPTYDTVEADPYVTIPPLSFMLATTEEHVTFDNKAKGLLWGRSSVGRLGLIPHTAGLVDAGYSGDLTLELVNLSPNPIELKKGMRLVQMTVHELRNPSTTDYGEQEGSKYQEQTGVTESRLYEDFADSEESATITRQSETDEDFQ